MEINYTKSKNKKLLQLNFLFGIKITKKKITKKKKKKKLENLILKIQNKNE